ncbi:uncharacterized protein LOC135369777 [Ornithodoros turicata]|uniref:uncharacterized protein LOC135369777 n=1 Tax=Ornithodoros turicata TaxID=34597 RepID=UPI003138F5B6
MFFQLPCLPKWVLFAYAYMVSLLTGWGPPADSYYDTDALIDSYDFLVVGGGSAGSVLANRLSANPGVRVLLIEAGAGPSAAIEVPSLFGAHNTCPHDWNYRTVPQKNACLGLDEQRSRWTRGKVLGGSSAINAMVFVRGNKRDYDQWAENGATGWSYKDVLPYFKSIESFNIPEYAENGYHGKEGELPINYASVHSAASDAFLEACKELGYEHVDYNGPSQTGCSRVQFNIRDGRRVSSAKAFILPVVKQRPNLHVSLRSTATKIEFEGKQAVGVHFEKDGAHHYVRATREVVLSAGAVASPQLLMLSGVGPKDHLRDLKIDVVADLPVGQNLQDHAFVGGLAATVHPDSTLQTRTLSALFSYFLHRDGPMSIPAGVEGLAFLHTPFVNASLDFPDIELIYAANPPSSEESEGFYRDLGFKQEAYNKYFLPKRGEDGVQFFTVLNRLKSTGEIKLKSTNPYEHPLIDPKYFSHPEDILVAIEAAKKTLEVFDSKAMKLLGAKRWDIPFPGCEDKTHWSDEYLECLARHLTFTTWHFCGTCAMGDDENAVVDPRLRVRGGVSNLRVIDASVMPYIVTGNLNAPTNMIGAKGAAMILEDHGLAVAQGCRCCVSSVESPQSTSNSEVNIFSNIMACHIPFHFHFHSSNWIYVVYAYVLSLLACLNPPPDCYYNADRLIDHYDFIIVGSGSAGSVVANRLSANPAIRVLLLEAGGAPNAGTEIPAVFCFHDNCPYDWKYKTVPQKDACLGFEEQRSKWTRGKVLGGSSAINAIMVVRGNKRDYDTWAANGATGWSYEEVLPYFKSIESFNISEYANNGYHGTDGELPINYASTPSATSVAFLQGCRELGYRNLDYNGPIQTGSSRVQFNMQDARRVSAAMAYIRPIVNQRPNLHISLRSTATKVEFEGKRAVGVHFEKNGTHYYIRACKEVILSAGAIGSPQLLMLSGVGPKGHLEEHKIEVVTDLPVGQNLQDHPFIGGLAASVAQDAVTHAPPLSPFTSYFEHKSGPLSLPAGIEALALVNTPLINSSLDYPDIELIYVGASPTSVEFEAFLKDLGYKQMVYDKYFLPKRGQSAFQIYAMLNRAKSTGEIKLKSTDPYDHPVIDPKYLSHPEDIMLAIEGAKKALAVIDSNAMKSFGVKRWDIPFPGCEEKVLWSDEYLECLVRHLTHTTWHFCGTCAMGTDKNAVVDERLRVRGGVTNLRVIDASVMPNIVTGHLNIPTQMIGAKGAAMVLEDHGLRFEL